MNRDKNNYLLPLLLAKGSMPLGNYIYHITGETYPDGMGGVQDDLDVLCLADYIRIERPRTYHHKHTEKTVYLTEAGYTACEKILDARQVKEFMEKDAQIAEKVK